MRTFLQFTMVIDPEATISLFPLEVSNYYMWSLYYCYAIQDN